jgi:hypothetical protein
MVSLSSAVALSCPGYSDDLHTGAFTPELPYGLSGFGYVLEHKKAKEKLFEIYLFEGAVSDLDNARSLRRS